MNFKQNKFVRFDDWRSEGKEELPTRNTINPEGSPSPRKRRPVFNRVWSGTSRGIEKVVNRIRSFRKPSMFSTRRNRLPVSVFESNCKVYDPQLPFLRRWNKCFVLCCLLSVSLDPLFFYIPVIDRQKYCLGLDTKLAIVASILRTITDAFYILHIIFQFRTGFIAPSSRVFSRGELVEDTQAIAKRYICSYLMVDVLSILPLPQVVGSLWYLFSIGRNDSCWREACQENLLCAYESLYCNKYQTSNNSFLRDACPPISLDSVDDFTKIFDFGIFCDAIKSSVLERKNFTRKFLYCFWWGLRNLSSLGQNLRTSTYEWEICFAVCISVIGLLLFSIIIGNMLQKFLPSISAKIEEMKEKKQDVEQWMSYRMLPTGLRDRVRRYEQYKWQQTRGIQEDNLLKGLPKDLRRDIKRHLCLALVRRVPMFELLDEQLLDAICERLTPVLYTENTYIVREGDPVEEMLFIMRGTIESLTTGGGRTDFFNSAYLKAGDFCEEEILTWALDPTSSSHLPSSTRTLRALTEVEVFALLADDMKFVAAQFRRLHSKQVQRTFRFYSQQWRTWAACFIQAAWRRYRDRKLSKCLEEEENRLQKALAEENEASPSLGATIYVSRFAANALRVLRRNEPGRARNSTRLLPLPPSPIMPDFSLNDDT